MDVLFESVFFDYMSFRFLNAINSFWTWLAVLMAASFSFWRIRRVCSNSGSPESDTTPVSDRNLDGSQLTDESTSHLESPEEKKEKAQVCSWASSDCAGEDDGRRKELYTVYYEDDGACDDRLTEVRSWGEDADGVNYSRKVDEDEPGWEKMCERRVRDFGWYRYQDITVLNGNVVRLWDGVRRRSLPSPSGVILW